MSSHLSYLKEFRDVPVPDGFFFFFKVSLFFLENWISHPSERLSHIYPYRRLFSTLPHGGSLKSSLFALLNLPCVLNRFSRVWLSVTLWTIASQAPLFMGSSRQEYWSGLPVPPPGGLPDPGIKPMPLMSPAWQAGLYHWCRVGYFREGGLGDTLAVPAAWLPDSRGTAEGPRWVWSGFPERGGSFVHRRAWRFVGRWRWGIQVLLCSFPFSHFPTW